MNLVKDKWQEEDIQPFLAYLESLSRPEKVAWSTNILQTSSPVLAITTADMVKIAKDIMKGNYLAFLDLHIIEYYETIALYGMILSRMKDFDLFLKYLRFYTDYMNCWAHCDLLNFPFLYEKSEVYLQLSKKYLDDMTPMIRRLGLGILFQYVKDEDYLPHIFDALLFLRAEDEYYVIMMAGWLLSECIILHRDDTLAFLENNTLNRLIQNKAIQKCRESNRLSKEEKDFLLKYKIMKPRY